MCKMNLSRRKSERSQPHFGSRSGKKQNRAAIIEAVWEEFEKYYDIYLKTEDMQGLVGEYDQKLANMNKQVRVLDPKDPYEGTARGINSQKES